MKQVVEIGLSSVPPNFSWAYKILQTLNEPIETNLLMYLVLLAQDHTTIMLPNRPMLPGALLSVDAHSTTTLKGANVIEERRSHERDDGLRKTESKAAICMD
ncbi:hypothetical protein TNCV_3877921 [Trichonephila clavipes]|uniref:Uncharacterized protein n=1 Tax=Trichonephila clavipes TaxID=2585209 RepID=A0A8X6VRI6_TRICX|nr:hypothetical protein TNCV_3877921 [Trichonephila clavipes]